MRASSMAPAGRSPEATGGGRKSLVALALPVLLAALGTSIANVGLESIAAGLEVPFAAVQWVVLAYLLASTVVVVSVGRFGDVIGRRRLLIAGVVLFTLASALCGLAVDLGTLLAARAAQGVGAAVMMALAVGLVGDTVPPTKSGSAMGLLGTVSATGTALGPSLGGLLLHVGGWRAIFLATVPIGLVAIRMTRRYLPADRSATGVRARADWPGMLSLGGALAAYALAATIGDGGYGAANLGLLAVALLGAALFVQVERTASSPMIRLDLLTPSLRTGLISSWAVSAVMMGTLVVGPFYLSRALGLSAAAVGLVVACGPAVAAVAAAPAGRLVDRVGARWIVVGGLAGIAAGSSALALLRTAAGAAGYIIPIVVMTGGYAFFQTANNTAVMRDVGSDHRGVVSGMLSLSRNLGLITGASALGAVFAAATGSADVVNATAASVATGTRATFAVAALMIGVTLLLVLFRDRRSAFGAGVTGTLTDPLIKHRAGARS